MFSCLHCLISQLINANQVDVVVSLAELDNLLAGGPRVFIAFTLLALVQDFAFEKR